MIKTVRYIALYPFSLLYGLIVGIRNFLFNKGILKSEKFKMPVISVGNLTVGGTGKTPHTEYILSVLQDDWEIAMLSRGYKRKTKGFRLADESIDYSTIGDEPFQIYRKFPKVKIAVDEERVHGVMELLNYFPQLQAVVLDDAFQHRYIQPGFSILLTDYSRLYTHDFYLPSGRLRESKKGSHRADLIIVTKCPENISKIEMDAVEEEIKPREYQMLFFSTYKYQPLKPVFSDVEEVVQLSDDTGVLLLAGIVSPQPMVDYLKNYTSRIETLFFPDHHDFAEKDINELCRKFDSMNMKEKIIVVTEKDASRLMSNDNYPEYLKSKTFALPIRVKILDDKENLFTEKIKEYVKENSRNS